MHYLLPSIIAVIVICTVWRSVWEIVSGRCGKAECSNIHQKFASTGLKCIYRANRCIAPAIHAIFDGDAQDAAQHAHIIYNQLKLLVQIHIEHGDTLTHSVQQFF
jgi:hypothetical protein